MWRRGGFFKGGCQHQVGRTGASISAGITPIIPGFLSNASPSPPASSWVSLEGEEQEPELILERGARPPASLGSPGHGTLHACKSLRKNCSDRNPSARHQPCGGARPCNESGGTIRALSGHTSEWKKKKKDEHVFPVYSRRDHPLRPSLQALHHQCIPLLRP